MTLQVAGEGVSPNSAFVTAPAQVQPLLAHLCIPVASGCTTALGLAHDEPKGAGRGQGAQEGGSGTTAFVSYCCKALGHPLIDWVWGRN